MRKNLYYYIIIFMDIIIFSISDVTLFKNDKDYDLFKFKF